jgi:hypothetical protein
MVAYALAAGIAPPHSFVCFRVCGRLSHLYPRGNLEVGVYKNSQDAVGASALMYIAAVLPARPTQLAHSVDEALAILDIGLRRTNQVVVPSTAV